MYYIFLENGKLNGCGECRRLDCENIEVTEDIYKQYSKTPNYYMYQDGELVINPDYEKEEEEKRKQEEITELKLELDNLDLKTVRPLRAINNGTATDYDVEKLNAIEQQAKEIRERIAELSNAD